MGGFPSGHVVIIHPEDDQVRRGLPRGVLPAGQVDGRRVDVPAVPVLAGAIHGQPEQAERIRLGREADAGFEPFDDLDEILGDGLAEGVVGHLVAAEVDHRPGGLMPAGPALFVVESAGVREDLLRQDQFPGRVLLFGQFRVRLRLLGRDDFVVGEPVFAFVGLLGDAFTGIRRL